MTFTSEHRGPGRPAGSRNKRTEEIWNRLENRGDLDPADLLSSIVTDKTESKELRAQAANFLLPYKYGKCGSIPQPRFVEESIDLPHPEPQTIEQASANIAYLSAHKVQGLISIDSADSIIADNQKFVDNTIVAEELRLKIANSPQAIRDQTIRIEGGLPIMPGCENLIMPQLNGHTIEAIAASADATTSPNESVPSQSEVPDP